MRSGERMLCTQSRPASWNGASGPVMSRCSHVFPFADAKSCSILIVVLFKFRKDSLKCGLQLVNLGAVRSG